MEYISEILNIDKDSMDLESIKFAAEKIKAGELVAFPTETVYGLGADGLNKEAVMKIYEAKGRPSDNPLILHISKMEDLYHLVAEIPDIAYRCMEKYWPGPLTIIFKKSHIVPDIITGGLDTVAIRMPDHPIALKLIEFSNTPIAAPSANLSGKPSPTKAKHVIDDMDGKISTIIDGGNTGIGLESTVLDLSSNIPIILRPGGITYEELKKLIKDLREDENIVNINKAPKSPGQKYRHYAPKGEMILFSGSMERVISKINEMAKAYMEKGDKVGIMCTDETMEEYRFGIIKSMGSRKNMRTIGANLFSVIRDFDFEDVDVILAESVNSHEIGMAIMNRMIKAAGGREIKLKEDPEENI